MGAIDTSIEVHCDRAWSADGKFHEGPPFSSTPSLYKRARRLGRHAA